MSSSSKEELAIVKSALHQWPGYYQPEHAVGPSGEFVCVACGTVFDTSDWANRHHLMIMLALAMETKTITIAPQIEVRHLKFEMGLRAMEAFDLSHLEF